MMCPRTSWATWASSSSERSWRSWGRSMRSRRRAMDGYRLRAAGEDEVGDLLELVRAAGRRLRQRRSCGGVALTGQRPCAVEAEVADVGRLAQALVAAARLAQGDLGAGDVEDVVDDLEEHAKLGREAPPGEDPRLVAA